jgi:hypothetical protein
MPEAVTFIHAPKCGGTSVGSALRARYIYSQATISLEESAALQVLLWPKATGLERFYREFEIRDMMMARLVMKGVRCISAHARYNPNLRAAEARPRRYVTVLREPVSRFLSHYLYVRRRHPVSVEGDTIDAFLESEQARRYGSEYLFYFAGRYQAGELDVDALIRSACVNLEGFDLVGDTARMDDFRQRVEQLLGVRLLKLQRNMRPEGSGPRFSATQLQRAREICAPDIAIYEHAMSARPSPPEQSGH